MNVYIKGIKLPKDEPGAFQVIVMYVGADGKLRAECKGTHEVVPVPPHGRLIVADALADVFRGFIAMYDSCPFSQLSLSDMSRRDELQAALAEVINAPTIIEAEEGE